MAREADINRHRYTVINALREAHLVTRELRDSAATWCKVVKREWKKRGEGFLAEEQHLQR